VKIFLLDQVFDEHGDFAYQYLEPVHVTQPRERRLFNGARKADTWNAEDAAVKVVNTRKPPANFMYCYGGALAADARAVSELYPILAEAGELLPLRTENGTPYTLVNVLPLVDCLDKGRSELRRLPSGTIAEVTRYEFVPSRLPARSMFKTDVRPGSEIFATEGHLPPPAEFKAQVDRLGLTGLRFREVWNDDGDPVDPMNPFDGVNINQK
jgi:hypothetical protein